MFENLIPFLIPAAGAGIAWLFGFSKQTILATGVTAFVVQAILMLIFATIEELKKRAAARAAERLVAWLNYPACRCGGGLKSVKRGVARRCRVCSRRYIFKPGSEIGCRFVEKLDTGYTLAYLTGSKEDKPWHWDIPPCRCGKPIVSIYRYNEPGSFVCDSCHREYELVYKPDEGVWFKEKSSADELVPYMKSIRWDQWEADGGTNTGLNSQTVINTVQN